MEWLRRLAQGHRDLKERIHATRIPLSKNGQRLATAGYMSLPLIAGYFIMNWATSKADQKWAAVRRPDGTIEYRLPDEVRNRGGLSEAVMGSSRASVVDVKEHIGEHPGRAHVGGR